MKVKVFSETTIYKLEDRVNSFLERHKDDEIIDIKYQGVGNYVSIGFKEQPSVMIIMR